MKLMAGLVLLLGGSLVEAAVNFEWSSSNGAVNRQSDGVTLMDDSFQFVIGNFTAGFDPETGGKDEWVENFEGIGMTMYLEEFQRFGAVSSIASNATPFGLGDEVYIWGRNGTESGSEWILVNSDSWSWPNANPIGPPIPIRLKMSTATDGEALIGSVNVDGVHMQSEKVTFDLSYLAWSKEEFESGEASEPGEDPDGDGNDNFFEYAVGSDPKKKDAGMSVSMNAVREIRIKRPAGREVAWSLEVSDDLTNFTAMVAGYEIVSDTSEELVFRVTGALGDRRFYRAVAVGL